MRTVRKFLGGEGREGGRKGGRLPAVVLEHMNKQAAAMVSMMAGRG